MANYNKVILMGRLTRDPELRYTKSETAICKLGLAVNRRFKDGATGEWKEEPTFVDVTIWGKRGEAYEKFHKKGDATFIEGSLRLDTWEDRESGQKRSKLYVVGDNWEFVGGGGGGSGGGGGGERSYEPSSAPAPAAGGYGSGGGNLDADDTPF
ncbi:MAG: single-stranded DNA-binding protein [Planctomycetota bacterium]|jgi:single-strand DNA-binding protein|nr:single-stranded DNA-binding protein [Planctomycetota bacterium]MDP6369183.1 single-stranded DNA-binding protein [Planctomycetota bacterium]MDP6518856.1 single-stranded DNA-binding protein [Planctomycetota bacterium]MDP6839337.1 single-stranded DNA-binding protein [Planctomycetota bacterium]